MTVPCEQPTSPPALLAFVAEAPGDHEVGLGHPLVGPSGRLLNAVLYSCGVRRSDCYVGNVFDFQLPNNDVTGICTREAQSSAMFPQTRRAVAPGFHIPVDLAEETLLRLQRELRQAQPGCIVALGSTAVWALLDLPRIKMKTIRGTVHTGGALGPWPVVPTWHPAYVLRSFTNRTMLEADIRKALEVSAGTYREMTIRPALPRTPADVELFLASTELCAVDIETQRGEIDCIGFSFNGVDAMTVPLADGKRRYWSAADEVRVMEVLARWLSNPARPKLFQNGQYDVWWIWEKWRIPVHGWHHDTRLAHHSVWPDQKKDLGTMAATHLNIPAWKARNEEGEK